MLPVHNHSEYSALDGYSKPREIAERIVELGLPGAFITDHGTVAGFHAFAKAMKERDLFVGYGMEAYQARWSREMREHPDTGKKFVGGEDSFHLVLLAKTYEGYLNLLRISDESHRTGFYYYPRIDYKLLEKYREGLIVTTACMGSLPCQRLKDEGDIEPFNRLHKIFRDDFYVELHTYDTDQQRDLNKMLVEVAQDRGYPVIYANDAHYAWPDDYDVHEALLCAQMGDRLNDIKGRKVNGEMVPYHPDNPVVRHPGCLYIMSEKEVRDALSDLPERIVDEAIENSDLLAQVCRYERPKPKLHLPKFSVREDFQNSADQLQALAVDGLERIYGADLTDEILDRVEFEFNAIVEAGLQDYFLIVWDYINHAKRHGKMVGPGRGSVGGSLLAYALGITAIDPLRYNLQFERFWNPGRAEGLPDIDVDFQKSARQFMIEYARRKYGEVLPIGNHIFMRPKSAIDKAGMVLYKDPPYGDMTLIKKIIEGTDDAGQQKSWDEMMELVESELSPYIRRHPDLFTLAECLAGRLSTYGVHASAVVISDTPLADHLPARMASDDEKNKVIVTQAEMKQVEQEGFPKFDFLGLRNLDTIMRAAILSGEFESEQEIIEHFWTQEWDDLPDDYWAMIEHGYTLGLFQMDESGSATRIGKQLAPRSIEDLAAIVALNRPGPDSEGYIARRRGNVEVEYLDPILEDILVTTYGMFVYQEQIIDYFKKVGYSLTDADHIRKIIGKKLGVEMQKEFPVYLEKAVEYMSEAKAKAIWQEIEDFSKYGFNKAHAVGYAIILAWTLYAKNKWPTEFIMASIETNPKKVGAYVNEARRIGVNVLPPDVNRSGVMISKSGTDIVYGLRDIKGIGEATARWVVDNAPYESIADFLEKRDVKQCPCNMGHFKKMMEAGAFDWAGHRLAECEMCGGKGKHRIDPSKRLLDSCESCGATGMVIVDLPDIEKRAKQEEELLGIALTDIHAHLVELHKDRLMRLDAFSSADVDSETEVKVPGIVKSVRKTKVRSDAGHFANRNMGHVTIQWQGDELTFVAFPDAWDEYEYMLKAGALGEFTLSTTKRGPRLKRGFRLV